MKLIEVIRWENSNAVVLAYADTAAELTGTLIQNGKALTISKGSLAYIADGSVYVYSTVWTKVGA